MSTDVDVRDGAASFVAKWRARWPEWELGMVFVPAAQRPVVEVWFTLLQELTDAAWGGADPTPGLAKLAWWQEELGGWSKGARRHPLGALLQPRSAVPWLALGRALPDLRALRGRDADEAAAPHGAGDVVAGQAFAAAVADCEASLFEGRADADARAVVLRGLLDERSLVQAAPSEAIDAADRKPGQTRSGTRPRGIASAFMAARRRSTGAALPPVRALLAAWRGARSPG